MKTIGSYEAKTNFSRLLDEVSGGQSITITRNGKAVAVLNPAHTSRENIARIIGEIRELRKGVTLGKSSIRELIDEGRRF
ncbi:MAG: type II toxin-antitoxin system Phd/YefM family antitoxin [Candidatus Eremiobacteraeota bacterium]|nr:type II toxin-antitoxin system Phd/YefM family antitoxin [Candidatus Eremiobacteraeota bacterium]